MNEKLKPSLRDRLKRAAGPTVLALGSLGVAGTFVDITTTTNNPIARDLNEIFPPASAEQLAKASEEIAIFDERTHQLVQQGKVVIDVPKTTQEAIKLVAEEKELQKNRQQKEDKLWTTKMKENGIRYASEMIGSLVLMATGILLWTRRQDNRRKAREALQQTNSTT